MAATVRVASGTGVLVVNGANTVIVTANHVAIPEVKRGPVRMWLRGSFSDCPVLARSKAVDLAVLAAPQDADGLGVELLARDLVPGEEVWTCGHPRGWPSADPPVLCRGVVAGVGEQHWANLEASWGNSGGALALVPGDGGALVGGLALGKAGEAHADLDAYRKHVEAALHVDPAVIDDVERLSERMKGFNA